MNTERPPTIDPLAARRWMRLADLKPPVVSPWLHEEVARRMAERLTWIVKKPASWLDWDPVRGGTEGHTLVAENLGDAECFMLAGHMERAQTAMKKIASPWWKPSRWVGAKAPWSPYAKPVELLWANMALHMEADPAVLIAHWHSLLQTDGYLMFSCLGPDTLKELRALYRAQGWPAPSHDFTDMHDWGDMLVKAGFADPVMDMERITLTFDTPERLLVELRELGRNLHVNRFPGLRGRRWRDSMCGRMADALGNPQDGGRLQLTFEVVYGHAIKVAARVPVRSQSTISLDDMRVALSKGYGQEPSAKGPPSR
jgi:malonyl-CoA O-methyltransferase